MLFTTEPSPQSREHLSSQYKFFEQREAGPTVRIHQSVEEEVPTAQTRRLEHVTCHSAVRGDSGTGLCFSSVPKSLPLMPSSLAAVKLRVILVSI